MTTEYDIEKIKYAIDSGTFERAVDLYASGKVTNVHDQGREVIATVRGGQSYRVSVSKSHFDAGGCECYLGQKDHLCKHMIALAIHCATNGKQLHEEDTKPVGEMQCSCRMGTLSKEELRIAKSDITAALRSIKPYSGPSRIWFAYQDSLMEGARRVATIFSKFPVSEQTSLLVVQTLLRIERKLMNGVDDSDGTVGGCIEQGVIMLEEYARHDRVCIKSFRQLCGLQTSFGWEDPLVKIVDEGVDGENVL